jgi:hypothetical protein
MVEKYTRSPCFKPFCFTAHCQYTPLLNFLLLILSLTPFGWLRFITLNSTYAIISYGNVIFYLHFFFYLSPHFEEHN